MNAYRERIYGSYLESHPEMELHSSMEGVSRRRWVANYMINNFFPVDRLANIVDLGCGHGALIHFGHQAGYHNMFGIDRSPQQVLMAELLGIKGVRQGELLSWLNSASDESLDMVLAFDIIEHFTKDELIGLIDEIKRVLKPGGRWLIHTSNADSPLFSGSSIHNDFTHETSFTSRSAKQLLSACGFKKVEAYEDPPLVHGVVSFIRRMIWNCMTFFFRFCWAVEKGSFSPVAVFTSEFFVVADK